MILGQPFDMKCNDCNAMMYLSVQENIHEDNDVASFIIGHIKGQIKGHIKGVVGSTAHFWSGETKAANIISHYSVIT